MSRDISLINPMTGELDKVLDVVYLDGRYVLIDQSTPQKVILGILVFDQGLRSDGDIRVKAGQKVIYDY